jgi:hypothetical protein
MVYFPHVEPAVDGAYCVFIDKLIAFEHLESAAIMTPVLNDATEGDGNLRLSEIMDLVAQQASVFIRRGDAARQLFRLDFLLPVRAGTSGRATGKRGIEVTRFLNASG